ncbi:UNVERIFIED_CONTAM: hypothetical protein FKN15_017458 [Acipenser sinensis]
MLLKDKELLETPLAVPINTSPDAADQADTQLREQNQEGSENQTTDKVNLSAASSALPWEERYEKIWVENEKREVKSHYKDVAAELKKKFGEICLEQSRQPSSISTHLRVDLNKEDDSSDEDEIVHQMAMTQSGILQPIPEQESSLEDSITEPSKPELKGSKIPDKAVNSNKQTEHLSKEDENEIQPLVQKRENDVAGYDTDLDSDSEQCAEEKPKCSLDGSRSSVENNTNPGHSKNSKEDDKYQDFVKTGQKKTPLSECAPASKYPSDEELEGDMQRFKNEVGMLKVVFLALEKEKAQLQKEANNTPQLEKQDSVTLVKIQNMFHEYERTIEREKGRYSMLSDNIAQLLNERKELQKALEAIQEVKSTLEHQQVEWETDLNNQKFILKQEQEKHKNAEMLYEKSREQLRKKEEQFRKEVEAKQQLELTLRNLEMEMRALISNMKQLEDERNEVQRLLSQERSARALQEGILNNHLHRQKEIEEENKKTVSKSTEVFSQLSEVSDREKDLLQQNRSLQDEISVLKLELDRVRARSQEEEGQYLEENEALKEKMEDLKRDLKLNEEALAQTVLQYSGQLNALKTESTMMTSKLEQEKQNKDKLETDVESLRARLTSALQELARSQSGKVDAERTFQRERDEWLRLQEKRTHETTSLRDSINSLSQQLSKAEAKANSLENECHRATLSHTEKSLQLESMQREREQAQSRLKELEGLLQAEKEQASKSSVRQESMQERMAQAQSENILLRQQLEEAQNKGIIKERAVSDVQDRFSDILTNLRADSEGRVQIMEERNKELMAKNVELREQVYGHQNEKAEREVDDKVIFTLHESW